MVRGRLVERIGVEIRRVTLAERSKFRWEEFNFWKGLY